MTYVDGYEDTQAALEALRAAVERGDSVAAATAARAAARAGANFAALDAASRADAAQGPVVADPLPLLGDALGLAVFEEIHGVGVPVTEAARALLPSGFAGDLAAAIGHATGWPVHAAVDTLLARARREATASMPGADQVNALFAYRTAHGRVRLALGPTPGTDRERLDDPAAASSHELSNAITAIAAIAQKALDSRDEHQRTDAIRLMLGLCDGAADAVRRFRASRPVHSTIDDEVELTDMRAVASELVDALRPLADARGVRLELRAEADAVVSISTVDVRSALFNLTKNAIEAAPEGGVATLSVDLWPNDIEFTVTDDGAGMDETLQTLAMEPYFTTKPDGSGIGLPLVRDIVDRHGGQLRIDSQPGAGTRVSVRFPLSSRASSEDASAASRSARKSGRNDRPSAAMPRARTRKG